MARFSSNQSLPSRRTAKRRVLTLMLASGLMISGFGSSSPLADTPNCGCESPVCCCDGHGEEPSCGLEEPTCGLETEEPTCGCGAITCDGGCGEKLHDVFNRRKKKKGNALYRSLDAVAGGIEKVFRLDKRHRRGEKICDDGCDSAMIEELSLPTPSAPMVPDGMLPPAHQYENHNDHQHGQHFHQTQPTETMPAVPQTNLPLNIDSQPQPIQVQPRFSEEPSHSTNVPDSHPGLPQPILDLPIHQAPDDHRSGNAHGSESHQPETFPETEVKTFKQPDRQPLRDIPAPAPSEPNQFEALEPYTPEPTEPFGETTEPDWLPNNTTPTPQNGASADTIPENDANSFSNELTNPFLDDPVETTEPQPIPTFKTPPLRSAPLEPAPIKDPKGAELPIEDLFNPGPLDEDPFAEDPFADDPFGDEEVRVRRFPTIRPSSYQAPVNTSRRSPSASPSQGFSRSQRHSSRRRVGTSSPTPMPPASLKRSGTSYQRPSSASRRVR